MSIIRAHMAYHIPIFTYHDADWHRFEAELTFLSKNSYLSLGAEELMQMGSRGEKKSVVLTFDDCRKSCYDIAYPILKRYSMKAIFFICPRFLDRTGESDGMPDYCSWDELREMLEAGVADFQNHSMEHELVFKSSKLVDFQRLSRSGRLLYGYFDSDGKHLPIGTPIYEYAWKGAVDRQFLPDQDVARSCSEHVERNGGIEFFEQKGWRGQLLKLHGQANDGGEGRMASIPFNRDEYIAASLGKSQEAIERNLGIVPHFFAPPVHSYDELVVKMLKRHAFRGIFNGSEKTSFDVDGFAIFGRRRSSSPLRLPGKGRESLLDRLFKRISP